MNMGIAVDGMGWPTCPLKQPYIHHTNIHVQNSDVVTTRRVKSSPGSIGKKHALIYARALHFVPMDAHLVYIGPMQTKWAPMGTKCRALIYALSMDSFAQHGHGMIRPTYIHTHVHTCMHACIHTNNKVIVNMHVWLVMWQHGIGRKYVWQRCLVAAKRKEPKSVYQENKWQAEHDSRVGSIIALLLLLLLYTRAKIHSTKSLKAKFALGLFKSRVHEKSLGEEGIGMPGNPLCYFNIV